MEKGGCGRRLERRREEVPLRLGVDTVVLAGTVTDCCVGTTARQAYERGFGAVVASDATATVLPGIHQAELSILRRSFEPVSMLWFSVCAQSWSHAGAC